MKHVVYIALILMALTGSVTPAPNAHSLQGRQILNTEPFTCDSETRTLSWTNETGTTLHVRQAQIWLGMDRQGVSDFSFWLVRASDETVLGVSNWDHYAEPVAPHHVNYQYAPDFIAIAPDDGLTLRYRCTNIENNPRGHITVTVWYFTAP